MRCNSRLTIFGRLAPGRGNVPVGVSVIGSVKIMTSKDQGDIAAAGLRPRSVVETLPSARCGLNQAANRQASAIVFSETSSSPPSSNPNGPPESSWATGCLLRRHSVRPEWRSWHPKLLAASDLQVAGWGSASIVSLFFSSVSGRFRSNTSSFAPGGKSKDG
jgi:hypothetical protein